VDRRVDLEFCEGDEYIYFFSFVCWVSFSVMLSLLNCRLFYGIAIFLFCGFWLKLCWISRICICMLILMLLALLFGVLIHCMLVLMLLDMAFGVLIQLHVGFDVTTYGFWSVNSSAC
jgi:hypothetical protein